MSNPPKSRHESWKLKSIPLEIQSDSQLLTRVVTLSTNDDDISSSLDNEMSEKWRREAVALLERVGSVDEELAGGRLGVMAAQAAGASMRLKFSCQQFCVAHTSSKDLPLEKKSAR